MLDSSASIDAFLNGIVSHLYARARASSAVPADGGMVVLDDPILIDEVLKSPEQFRKNYSLLSILGKNRFNANGNEWQCRRNLTQPSYTQAANSRNRSSIYAVYETSLSDCESTTPSAIQNALLKAAITVFCRSLNCTIDINALLGFFARVRPIFKAAQYFSWGGPSHLELSQLAEHARAALAEFAAEIERSPDLIKLMNRFQDEADSIPRFSPQEELLMNFLAGIETSVATQSWAITCLGADGSVQDRIHREVMHEEQSYPNLEHFLNETMRYFPAVPFVTREIVLDGKLGSIDLHANNLILLSIVGVHHHRDYWKDPDIFNAKRSEFVENSYDRRAFIPFLTGPRMCGGARLARVELTEGLKAFVRLFSVEWCSEEFPLVHDYGLAMRPNSWKHIKITWRGRGG